MNVSQEKQNSFIVTDGSQALSASTFALWLNSYSRFKAQIMCIDQNSGKMRTLQLMTCIQREVGSGRMAGTVQKSNENGDSELSGIGADIQINGTAANVVVTGLDGLKLTWCVQLEIDIVRTDSLLRKIKRIFLWN